MNRLIDSKNGLTVFWVVLLSWSTCASSLWGQISYGSFRGTVTDKTEAVVPSVEVTITEQRTGVVTKVVTSEDGSYQIASALPGLYTFSVEHRGFKKYVNTDLVLYANDVRRVNIQLELGEIAESIEVQSAAPAINTETATLSTPFSEKVMLFGAGFGSHRHDNGMVLYHMALTPGTQYSVQPGRNFINHGAHANEARSNTDGMNADSRGIFRTSQFTISETKLHLVNTPAEFQTNATATATTRSGTNEYHGTALLEVTNVALNALAPTFRGPRPPGTPGHQTEFQVGGPVRIPHLYDGRNRSFFNFVIYPQSIRGLSFPTFVYPYQRMRDGDLSIYSLPIKDPLTGQNFANNLIPQNRISPISRQMLNDMPLPNAPGAEVLTVNHTVSTIQETNRLDWNFRIDHQLVQNNNLSFIFYSLRSENLSPFDINPNDGGINAIQKAIAFNIMDTHSFSPRIVNEFGFSRINILRQDNNGNRSGRQYLQSIGLTNLGGREVPDSLGAPRLNITGFGSTAFLGVNILGRIQGVVDNNDPRWTVRDNVIFHSGRHIFKTGFDIRIYSPNQLSVGGDAWGTYGFNGLFSGNPFADFLLGYPDSTAITRPRTTVSERKRELGFFFQDDFKVNSQLTLNLGVRYQAFNVPTEANGLFYNYDAQNLRLVVKDEKAKAAVHPAYPKAIPIVTAAEAGYPDSLVDASLNGFEPRIGLAWQPLGPKFVVRAGYGLFHVPPVENNTLAGRQTGPFQLGESFGPNRIVGGVPELTLDTPFPSGPGRVGLQSVIALPKGYRSPHTQQWSLTLEQELGLGWAGRMSYIGSKGTQWRYQRELTQPPASTLPFSPSRRLIQPGDVYGSVRLAENGANMSYHGAEIEATRRFQTGLFFQGSFTWSRRITEVDDSPNEYGLVLQDSFSRAAERGRSNGYQEQMLVATWVYDLPLGRGQRFLNLPSGHGWSVLNHILSGWIVSGTVFGSAGAQWTPTYSGFDSAGTGVTTGRTNVACDGNKRVGPEKYYVKDCYPLPLAGTFGNAPRGSLRGPGYWNMNGVVFKDFILASKWGERSPRLRFSFRGSNVLNHPTQYGVVTNITAPNFGDAPFSQNPGLWHGQRFVWLTAQVVF